MTIAIPAGTSLTPYLGRGGSMYVADDSTAEIVDFDIHADTFVIRFEDGEEYTVDRRALMVKTAIYTNPGNNVTHVNGVPVSDDANEWIEWSS